MEPQQVIIERRRHPRYHPDRKNQPQVSFTLNGGDKHVIDVVNISQGGLLGYTHKNEHLGPVNHKRIKQIEISFPGKLPFHCSGELLRVKPTRERYKCFCAIQFDEIGYDAVWKTTNSGIKLLGRGIPANFTAGNAILAPKGNRLKFIGAARLSGGTGSPRAFLGRGL